MRRSGVILAALLLLAEAGAASAAPAYRAPRTHWGAPDLQGGWTNASLTKLERPPGVSALEVPAAQAPALEAEMRRVMVERPNDAIGQGHAEWSDPASLARIDGAYRTSWLTDPPDGKLPYRPEAAKARAAAAAGVLDDPESLTTSDRCIRPGWSAAGPPMLNSIYAPNYRILQTRDEVVIVTEINHEVRHIRLNAPHLPSTIRPWGGDSVGRWEGDTLVVETVGFHPQESYRPPVFLMSKDARVVERFRRVGAGEIRYAFEVDDPATFTRTWRGEAVFRATDTPLYEYACHEGNYSLPGMLAGARTAEAEARAAAAHPVGR